MTHITCRLIANYRDQLQNPTLGIRVWAIFFTVVKHTVQYTQCTSFHSLQTHLPLSGEDIVSTFSVAWQRYTLRQMLSCIFVIFISLTSFKQYVTSVQ